MSINMTLKMMAKDIINKKGLNSGYVKYFNKTVNIYNKSDIVDSWNDAVEDWEAFKEAAHKKLLKK